MVGADRVIRLHRAARAGRRATRPRVSAIVGNETPERLDEELDRRADPIARAANQLELERMQTEVESLIVTLQRDLIDADDFAR